MLQLSFLSLITCENLSPSFYGLSYLAYSCGYNIKTIENSSVKMGRKYSPIGQMRPFLDNYNVTAVLFLLPLILSLVFALVNRLKYKSQNAFLLKHSQLLRGEGCFYGLMFSAYEIVLALCIEVMNIGSGMVGLAIGGALTLLLVLFAVLLHKYPELFGEFFEKFNRDNCIQSHYYCLLVGERVLTVGCLAMAFFSPQSAIIIGILAVQMVLVLWKQPYKGERAWLRPFLNLLFSVLVQAIYVLLPMLSSSPTYSSYAPYAIEAVLAAVLAYNIYYYVKHLREKSES